MSALAGDTPVRRAARGLVLLTAASIVRMLREGLVLRSMVWPGLVVSTTLAVTLIVASLLRPGRDLAVGPTTDPALVAELDDAGFAVYPVDDPGTEVHRGGYSLGTDGHTVWIYGTPPAALELEARVRTRVSAPWQPVPIPLPEPTGDFSRGDVGCHVLALLFVLYGLVFGLGGVARDRDDGTLEAELALPIPRWVGGMARWIASTLILSSFYVVSILVVSSVLPVPGFAPVLWNGIAACGAGAAIGLAVVGSAGIKQGFSGPFAAGMTFATGLATVGAALGATWLPIASLFAGGSGGSALAVSVGTGIGSALLYGWRAGDGAARWSWGRVR
ncbi:MAG: ABC transporter permease subunit [Myxococcota bacterium]